MEQHLSRFAAHCEKNGLGVIYPFQQHFAAGRSIFEMAMRITDVLGSKYAIDLGFCGCCLNGRQEGLDQLLVLKDASEREAKYAFVFVVQGPKRNGAHVQEYVRYPLDIGPTVLNERAGAHAHNAPSRTEALEVPCNRLAAGRVEDNVKIADASIVDIGFSQHASGTVLVDVVELVG